MPQIHLGILSNFNSVDAYFLPGAPSLGSTGAPFFSPRVATQPEIEATLKAQYDYYTAFPVLTVEPPPYGLELTIGEVPDAVSGRTVNVPVTLTKEGGFTGDIEWVVQSSNASLRVGEPFQEGDDTAQDWLIPVTAEEGIPAGDYTVTVTVRAVGQTTSELLKGVIDIEAFGITVRLGDPALVTGTTRFNALAAWRDKSFTTMWANGVAGQTGGVLVPKGLARQTSRWDGAWGDGTNFSQWGGSARVTSVDYVANMAADHYLQFAIPDAATWATGTVFLTISSQVNKFQYWQVYKAADGIKVRTSTGTTSATQAESGNSLPFVTGIMDLAVTVTGGTVGLINPKTEAVVTTPAVTWAGAGKLTLFAAELSDGTVQGLSKACVLSIASGPVIPSIFQLERQAEYFRGFMLRASTYERAEYPDATYAIFLADVGNVLRNYHPATSGQTMISKGTGATTSSGSFLTTGAAETGWRTGYITGSSGAQANDVIWTMRNLSASGGNGLVKFGVSFYDSSNTYTRMGANGDTLRRFFTQFNVNGTTTVTSTDTSASPTGGTIPMTGIQTWVQRFNPSLKRVSTVHIPSGKTQSNDYDSWTITGRLQAVVGATHRGLQADGTARGDGATGLEFEVQSDCLGIIMVAKNTSAAEQANAAANISGTYDYSGIVLGGADGGGGVVTPPPTGGGVVPAATDVSFVAVADADFNRTSFFGASGTLRDKFDRLENFVKIGGLNAAGAPHLNRWDDTTKAYRGQYHISRALGNFGRAYCFATGATKWLEWSRQAQALWNKAKALLDRNSRPNNAGTSSYDGWGYGTKGSGATVPYVGQRIELEAGVSTGGMTIAYLLNKNKHLDSTFQATIDSQCAWYDNHHIFSWDTYWLDNNATLHAQPLHAKKPFTHAYLAEVQGAFCRASIRAGSLWYNDPIGVEALNGFALWYQTSATQIIPVANFKYAEYASYGPARVWGQYVPALKQQSDPQFFQPVGYLNETIPILAFLYLEGFLTRALGTQAAADTFMAEVVSGVNLGVLVEPLRASKKVAGNMAGSYTLTDLTKTSWMFTSRPAWDGTAAVEEAITPEGQIWAIGAFDTSNRIGTIHDELHAASSGAKAGNKGFFTANVHHLFQSVFRDGRRN